MAAAHSDKALKTFEQMVTRAEQWGLVEIEWRKETRMVPTKVKCPNCGGGGQVYFRKAGGSYLCGKYDLSKHVAAWVEREGKPRFAYLANERAFIEAEGIVLRACNVCPARRKWGGQYGTGEVVAWRPREVMVGYPQWAAGTLFDSRFGPNSDAYYNHSGRTVCELCSKSINLGGRVPVTGRGGDGRIHGMWVGEDCARKFCNVTHNFKKDEFLADNLTATDAAAAPGS